MKTVYCKNKRTNLLYILGKASTNISYLCDVLLQDNVKNDKSQGEGHVILIKIRDADFSALD